MATGKHRKTSHTG